MPVVMTGKGPIHYEVLGDGPVVIFIHGWFEAWFIWRPIMETFSDRHRMYALDLYGFGESGRSVDAYWFWQQADMVRDFMDTLGLDSVSIVGHAIGGAIALLLAAQTPDRVSRLAMINPPLVGLTRVRRRVRKSSPDVWLRGLLEKGHPYYGAIYSHAATRLSPETLWTLAGTFKGFDWRAAIGAFHKECLMILSTHDPLVPPLKESRFEGLGGNVRRALLDGAGHYPMLGGEAPALRRLLLEFLDTACCVPTGP